MKHRYFVSGKHTRKRARKLWHATDGDKFSLCGVRIPYYPADASPKADLFDFIPANADLCVRCNRALGKELAA